MNFFKTHSFWILFNLFIFCIIFGTFIISCNRSDRFSGYSMGTYYTVQFDQQYSGQELSEIQNIVQDELNSLEGIFSTYREDSEISKINLSAKNEIEVSASMKEVLTTAFLLSEKSGGAFDPALNPLIEAWGFGKRKITNFSPLQIEEAKRNSGQRFFSLKNNILYKINPASGLNLNGIAKGYAVDKVFKLLEKRGYHAIVEIGGEVRAGNATFRVGLDAPGAADSFVISSVSIATSGTGYNQKTVNHRKIHHILNARTGYPAVTNVLSASVIGPECMVADALAKLPFVMQPVEAVKVIISLGYDAYIIEEVEGVRKVTITDGARKWLYKKMSPHRNDFENENQVNFLVFCCDPFYFIWSPFCRGVQQSRGCYQRSLP